ncbi:hypothetical protein Tco_0561830 [Tanacetum coccineum]
MHVAKTLSRHTLKLATMDPSGDITVQISPPKRSLMPDSFGLQYTKMPTRCPGFLKPLVLAVFVLRSQELHNPQLHLGIPIS